MHPGEEVDVQSPLAIVCDEEEDVHGFTDFTPVKGAPGRLFVWQAYVKNHEFAQVGQGCGLGLG